MKHEATQFISMIHNHDSQILKLQIIYNFTVYSPSECTITGTQPYPTNKPMNRKLDLLLNLPIALSAKNLAEYSYRCNVSIHFIYSKLK